jgi:hypothetical protein
MDIIEGDIMDLQSEIKPKVTLDKLEEKGNLISFTVTSDRSKMVKMRHRLLSGFPFFALDEIKVDEDAGYMTHWQLTHRFQMLPILCKAETYDDFQRITFPEDDIVFSVDVNNETEEILEVNQSHIQSSSFFSEFFSFYPNPIPLYELKPGKSLKLNGKVVRGDGNKHAMFSVVSKVAFYLDVEGEVTLEKLMEERKKYPWFDVTPEEVVLYDQETGVRNPPRDHFTKNFHYFEPQVAPWKVKITTLQKVSPKVIEGFILSLL